MKNDYNFLSHKGQLLLDKKQYKKAKSIYDTIIENFPNQFFGWYNHGVCALHLESIQEAKESFHKALSLRPDDSYTLNELSLIHFKLKEFSLAQNLIQKALLIDPNNATLHNTHGIIAFNEGAYSVAQKSFQKALELRPTFKEAKLNLEDCYEYTRVVK